MDKKIEFVCFLACCGLSCFTLGCLTPDLYKSIRTKFRFRKLEKELKALETIIRWQEKYKHYNEES